MRSLADLRGSLTPADHQTQRWLFFEVPRRCAELRLRVIYAPKYLAGDPAVELIRGAIRTQAEMLRAALPLSSEAADLLAAWREQYALPPGEPARLPNLVTVSLDDAAGSYRGAGHRQDPEQEVSLRLDGASAGFLPGPLPPGRWALCLSVHTLVTPACQFRVQIGAVTARSDRSAPRATA